MTNKSKVVIALILLILVVRGWELVHRHSAMTEVARTLKARKELARTMAAFSNG